MENILDKLSEIEKVIGKTPMIEISFLYKNKVCKIYSKLESFNYTGSIKDRMALYILKRAYSEDRIRNNYTIVEATSGNTGISLAAIGSYLGNRTKIYMPDWMSSERKLILKSFGAELKLVSKEEGGFLQCIVKTIEESNNNNNIFLPSQFSNEDNSSAHYLTTGPEIINKFCSSNLKPNAFVSGVGTGGTLMGVGKFLKEYDSSTRIYAIEPKNSPTLSTGTIVKEHRIQGIVDEFVPPLFKRAKINSILPIDDGDAIIMAQTLSSCLGLGVGISSGANFLGCIKALDILGLDSVICTIFPDDNKKYLSTDLMKTEPIKDDFISSKIELLDLNVL